MLESRAGNEEERRRIASRGGKASTAVLAERRGRAAQEVRELKDDLRYLAKEVKEGTVPLAVGTVLNQIQNTRIRAMEQERRAGESVECEERLSALEERAALRRGASA